MDAPIAATRFGRLAGERCGDGGVLRFRGVPYAKPPVAALRWRAPVPPERWSGVRPANSFAPAAPQPVFPEETPLYGQERIRGEDCLYLNVWTASLDAADKRPVILWLHHGGFVSGWSGAPFYDGVALAAAGAVFVSINYRLGRLGFLAHPLLSAESGHGASGNYGLMDQMAALHWVRENIAGFGGDPDRVTVYGVSAGGYSASVLLTSPLSAGLFDRVVCGSGGAFGPPADSSMGGDFLQTLDAAEALGATVMRELGAHDLDAMRRLSAEAITDARPTEMIGAPPGFLDGTYPILDGHVLRSDATQAYRERRFHDVPVITGSNAREAAFTPFNPDTASYLTDNRHLFGPLFDRFLALFPAGDDGLTMRSSQESQSDRLFTWQNWALARLHGEQATAPVYYYRFDQAPPAPAMPGMDPLGAFHSGELPYVLRNFATRDWPWSEADRALSETMSGYWLDFARTGDPNGGGRPHWPRFDGASRARMLFGDGRATPGPTPPSERMALLDDLYAWARETGAVHLPRH